MQNSHLTFQSVADRYGVSLWIIRKIADRLQIGFKSGSYWFFSVEDLPALEIGLKVLGHRIPPVAEPVAPDVEPSCRPD
jgi:hypothetical protein